MASFCRLRASASRHGSASAPELEPEGWPARHLRTAYDSYLGDYQAGLRAFFRRHTMSDASVPRVEGTAYDDPMSDRFYFRQLLSGRDFAQNDPVARQMVNFVYAIGDRQTGDAVWSIRPTTSTAWSTRSRPTACAALGYLPRTTTPIMWAAP